MNTGDAHNRRNRMATFNEVMQSYVNLPYEDLVLIARKALSDLLPICKEVDPDHEGILMTSSLVLSALAADGVLSEKEQQFLADVFEFDTETVGKYMAMYSPEMVSLADEFADQLSDAVKTDCLTLVIAVAACDETISREETALIRKILA